MKHNNNAQKLTVSEQSAIQRRYFLVCKKKPVDFDDVLKIVDVRYDNMT